MKLMIVAEVETYEQAAAILRTLVSLGIRKGRIECQLEESGKVSRAAIGMPDPKVHPDMEKFVRAFAKAAQSSARRKANS